MEFSADLLNNTVKAAHQLADSEFVTFHDTPGAQKKVLFVGNSITRHGVCPEIGWHRDCGMAASDISRDYVHLTVQALEKRFGRISWCIAQAAEWERNFWSDTVLWEKYSAAREFQADLVIIRIGENTNREKLAAENYEAAFRKMIRFFAPETALTVVTGLFWRSAALDGPIAQAAQKEGCRWVEIGDLGDRDDMKALTEYEHAGVAAHPGDKGMAAIAGRIMDAI